MIEDVVLRGEWQVLRAVDLVFLPDSFTCFVGPNRQASKLSG